MLWYYIILYTMNNNDFNRTSLLVEKTKTKTKINEKISLYYHNLLHLFFIYLFFYFKYLRFIVKSIYFQHCVHHNIIYNKSQHRYIFFQFNF